MVVLFTRKVGINCVLVIVNNLLLIPFFTFCVHCVGFGYADIENHVCCNSNTVLRIASISKSMTMAVVAKLWQEGKLSLDKDIREYVPNFPEKYFEGEKVIKNFSLSFHFIP